jgi:uncharacterized BrkB/YihY/UPF0761 family membrane protein
MRNDLVEKSKYFIYSLTLAVSTILSVVYHVKEGEGISRMTLINILWSAIVIFAVTIVLLLTIKIINNYRSKTKLSRDIWQIIVLGATFFVGFLIIDQIVAIIISGF